MIPIEEDVKRKLKNAIVTKIEELGCNYEKELPEYILSIITNGKDKEYMTRALSVFLTKNKSPIFVEWLYDIFGRLSVHQLSTAVGDNRSNSNVRENGCRKRKSSESGYVAPNESKRIGIDFFNNQRTDRYKRNEKLYNVESQVRHRKQSERAPSAEHDREKESRSYSDMEVDSPIVTKVASTVVCRQVTPEPRVASKVIVKRKLPEKRDNSSNLFHKAMSGLRNCFTPYKVSPKNNIKIELNRGESLSPDKSVIVSLEKPKAMDRNPVRKIEVINKQENKREEAPPGLLERFSISEEELKNGRVFNVTPIPYISNMDSKSSSSKTRCRYWPECTNERCNFIHPNKTCDKFPKCIFGTECIFVHPPCRYAKLCHNGYCTYTHASVEALRQVEEVIRKAKEDEKIENGGESIVNTACFYGGQCLNSKCKYKHPQACRYAENCKNKNCLYYHGPIKREDHQPNQFKWRSAA